jgi:hypothetical protein
LKGKKVLVSDYQGSLKKRVKIKIESIKKLRDVSLGEDEHAIIKVGSTLTPTQ